MDTRIQNRRRQIWRRCARWLGVVAAVCLTGWPCGGGDFGAEYQVKAAFLYNLARFVDWPKLKFDSPEAPLVIGILGDNPFGGALDMIVKDKLVNLHPIQVVQVKDESEAKQCHILFLCRSMRQTYDQYLPGLAGAHVLTVSDIERFARRRGVVGLVVENERVKLEINPKAAMEAGLTVSSQLLRIARLVTEAPQ